MTIRQLYYTSCEQGLSGFAGFQFNAATPGTPAGVLRYVEGVTAYEPPSSVGFEPTEAAIAACPASLVYAVDDATVVANVVFTGADFTNRFGNYFAHALVADDRQHGFGAVLPIELWRAPWWVGKETTVRELPAIDPPLQTGTIDRATIESHLKNHRFSDRLPALLSATARSVCDEDRSVVIIDDVDEVIARWIAVLSYLLPGNITRSMSFTTFNNRPAYCPLRVVGTVPAADIDRSDAAFDSMYYLFDFTSGRATAVDVHPLARILVAEGPTRSEALWLRASELARGNERGLDDWYPVVLASQDVATRRTEAETNIILDWLLTDANRLGPDRVSVVATPLLAAVHAESQLARVAEAGRTAGATKVVERAETRLVDMVLDRLLAGDRPGFIPLSTRQANRHAAERCATVLRDNPPYALDILDWAAAGRLPVDHDTLVAAGHRWVGPALFRPDETTDLLSLIRDSPLILAGVVTYLEERSRSDARAVSNLLAGAVGRAVRGASLGATPALKMLVLLEEARQDPSCRVEVLDQMLSLQEGTGKASDRWVSDVLAELWPGEQWSPSEAQRVVAILSDEQATVPAVVERVRASLLADVPLDEAYVALCRSVRKSPVFGELSVPASACVVSAVRARERIHYFEQVGDRASLEGACRDLRASLDGSTGPVRSALLAALVLGMEHLPGPQLAEAILGASDDMIDGFGQRLRERMDPHSPDVGLAARVLHASFFMTERRMSDNVGLDGILAAGLGGWRRRDVSSLAKALAGIDPVLETRFRLWQEGRQPAAKGGRFRLRRDKK